MSTAEKPKHGYDGNEPEFMPARDVTARDPVTGKMRRETPDGPINVNTDRIEYLFAHGSISKRQYEAANRLMQDDYFGHTDNPTTVGVVFVNGGSDLSVPDRREKASRDYARAKAQFVGWRANSWPFIVAVALHNLTIDDTATLLRTDKRFAKHMLRTGLHLLADHYGYEDA